MSLQHRVWLNLNQFSDEPGSRAAAARSLGPLAGPETGGGDVPLALCSVENALPLIVVAQVDTGELSLEMQNHLQLNTYLDTNDTNFWSKLRSDNMLIGDL